MERYFLIMFFMEKDDGYLYESGFQKNDDKCFYEEVENI